MYVSLSRVREFYDKTSVSYPSLPSTLQPPHPQEPLKYKGLLHFVIMKTNTQQHTILGVPPLPEYILETIHVIIIKKEQDFPTPLAR